MLGGFMSPHARGRPAPPSVTSPSVCPLRLDPPSPRHSPCPFTTVADMRQLCSKRALN